MDSEIKKQSHKELSISDVNNSEIFEIPGTIKWFDFTKGYGFILANDVRLPDILVHVSDFEKAGYDTIYKGAEVVCEVLKKMRGLQVHRIISLDNSNAVTDDPENTQKPVMPIVEKISDFQPATVKWFDKEKGYGFLSIENVEGDIFIHVEVLQACGKIDLAQGQKVFVCYGDGEKGLIATKIHSEVWMLPN